MFHEKVRLVQEVFATVAEKYDIMNDLMSFGLHRLWKKQFIDDIAQECALISHKIQEEKGETDANSEKTALNSEKTKKIAILDLAAGTGDIAFALLRALNHARVTLCDPSEAMLSVAKKRLINEHFAYNNRCNFQNSAAENLLFPENSFDICTLSFGLRNFSEIERSLHEVRRVIKPGGHFFCLEFIRQEPGLLRCAYNLYAKQIIPKLGYIIAKSKSSYDYLVDSIENFYNFEELSELFEDNGFAIQEKRKVIPGVAAIFILKKLE
jgi:demethylmenaquinone methyltransferase/2-methoxy-6-polyprenyl-1,4-benzoquinol methylase